MYVHMYMYVRRLEPSTTRSSHKKMSVNPGSSLAVGSLVLTSSVNSGVTISRPVITTGRTSTTGNSAGPDVTASTLSSGTTGTQPNVAATLQACLTSHLLEQTRNNLQRRAPTLVPRTQSVSSAANAVPQKSSAPVQKTTSTHASPKQNFRLRVTNPDCKKQ